MKRLLLFVLILLLVPLGRLSAQTYQPTWDSIDKRPTPAWFTDAKFGIFIHWGVYSVPAYAPVIPGKAGLRRVVLERDDRRAGTTPRRIPSRPAPGPFTRRCTARTSPIRTSRRSSARELFDPDHWADVFARSGAKYVVLTSKHHEGFALWPSKEASATWGRPWNAVEIGPQRDLLGDLTDAVRRKGLRMGFYYSLYEWYNPLWLYRQAALHPRAHVSAVQGPGHALQAVPSSSATASGT